MALNPSDFITRNALESLSIRYGNEQTDFVADSVFHPAPSPKDVVKVWQYDVSQYRNVSTKTASKAVANSIDFSGFYTNRTLDLHKLRASIDPKDEVNADSVVSDLQAEAAMHIMDGLLIDKEVEAATLAQTTTNYVSGLTSTLGATATWAVDGGDPAADAKTARIAVKNSCGKMANALVLSWTAFEHLRENAALKDRVKYTQGQSLGEDIIKNLLGVQFLFVAKAQKNTNVEGNATQTLSDIWNDNAVFFVYDPAPRRKKLCYGIQPIRNRIYTHQFVDDERGSDDGRVKVLEMGWNYVLASGAVESSSSTKFTAGYCLANVY